MRLKFNNQRAREVFTVLQEKWTKKEGVFRGIVLPQEKINLPEGLVEQANFFLFTAITQRGGIVSEDPVKYVQELRKKYPELFHPQAIVDRWSPHAIEGALKEIVIERAWAPARAPKPLSSQLHLFPPSQEDVPDLVPETKKLYKIDEFAQSWHRNAVTLATRFDGSVLNAYEGVRDFEEFFARVDYRRHTHGLHGMRRKILALLTIWLQEVDLVPTFRTPIPVDFHALKLLFGTGVVRGVNIPAFTPGPKHAPGLAGRRVIRITEKITDTIALWSYRFMEPNGFSHLAINPALWVLGRELCPHEFQNKTRGRGAKTQLVSARDLKADHRLWPYPYKDPVPHCPLSGLCTKVAPWSPYYDNGIIALDERVPYPNRSLPGALLASQLNVRRKNDRG